MSKSFCSTLTDDHEQNETVGSWTMGPLLDSFNDAHDIAGCCRQDMLKVSLVEFSLDNTDSFLHFGFVFVPGLRTDNFCQGLAVPTPAIGDAIFEQLSEDSACSQDTRNSENQTPNSSFRLPDTHSQN
ncbi:MAG: hypothetical protein AAFR26_01380 [Cyanobacteria bacterium J06626_4]